ncbi:GNAT family N-acetyltransferase [Cellulosimicrobium sp. PMB13]|uniref:GNAT family N-acetyltransferase n=1 Tax=Cellulosimicrobium sp. PMB13 TaxID=3120158 RepID=UPI003F4B4734
MTVTAHGADGARTASAPGVPVSVVAGDDADALALFARQQAELAERYGEPDSGAFDATELLAALVVRDGAEPVACVALRDVSGTPDGRGGHHAASTGEVKRLFVAPEHRGRGHARTAMRAVHEHASATGLRRLVLETGTRQPESIDLYLDLGYLPTESYGHYAGDPLSRCFALDLDRAANGDGATARRRPTGSDAGSVGPGGVATVSDRRAAGPGAREEIAVRAVPWEDRDAFALRREMHDTSSAVLYPELFPGLEAAGGFEAVDGRLGAETVATFVAWRGGEPLGCVSLRDVAAGASAAHGAALEVKKLFVRETARGAGVARTLMASVEVEARRRGATTLLLETGIRQPDAITLYRSLGFRAVLPYPPFDRGDNGIALCFAKPLR